MEKKGSSPRKTVKKYKPPLAAEEKRSKTLKPVSKSENDEEIDNSYFIDGIEDIYDDDSRGYEDDYFEGEY